MTRTRAATSTLIASAAALSALLSACSGGSSSTVISNTSTTQSSTNTTNPTNTSQITASSEYLAFVAPVDRAERIFKASTTGVQAEVRAAPFASALETWSTELSGFSWPGSAQSDVRTLTADIPPLVSDLRGVAAGDFADISRARIDGAPVTSGAGRVRHDLGLQATG
jgi:hypothetical protein